MHVPHLGIPREDLEHVKCRLLGGDIVVLDVHVRHCGEIHRTQKRCGIHECFVGDDEQCLQRSRQRQERARRCHIVRIPFVDLDAY